MLTIRDLALVRGKRTLLTGLNLDIAPGQCWLVLGENGCGKSTLLATLAGWLKPASGSIALAGKPVAEWAARERAVKMAWLPQGDETPFSIAVLAKTLTGREPHLSRWDWESAADIALARAQLARLDLAGFETRDLVTLSGGERRRVALATTLTQDADLLLLDEPLSQLDLCHQQQALQVLREESSRGKTLLLVGHDPNHARGFASHALLLFGDGRWLAGPAGDVLTSEHLSALYRHPVRTIKDASGLWFVPEPACG